MKYSIVLVTGFAFMLLGSFLSTMSGFWYIVALFGISTGIALGHEKFAAFVSAIGGVVGSAIYIVAIDGSSGLGQAGLLSGIIGIPGGSAPVLVITLLIVFFLSLLGYFAGSSIITSGEPDGTETQAKEGQE